MTEEPEKQVEELEEREKELDRQIEETEQDWEKTQREVPSARRRGSRWTRTTSAVAKRFAIQSAFWIENPSQSLLK